MGCAATVLWDDAAFTAYDFGPAHPLRPLRLELTMALAAELGVLDRATLTAPTAADAATLELVHDPLYIGAVRRAPDDLVGRISLRYGLGTGDNPVFARMHESAALVTGASVDAARTVWEGRSAHAVNISGGLHHAMADRASGFCIYDDPAVAIAWLLAAGARRVAYVDVDVHHGDGVQAAFYDDPRVLTVSLHESGRTLFPGTGFATELGGPAARGSSVNVALPAGTGDSGWLRAFGAVVPAVLQAFRPEVLVTQHGCDTHRLDPLANLRMSVQGQRAGLRWLHALAHEVAGGRWVALGGGGYAAVQVVPRAWTHLLAEVTGSSVDGAVPDGWRELVGERSGEDAPVSLTDGQGLPSYDCWPGGEAPVRDTLDASIEAARTAAFPLLGLDPLAPGAVPPAAALPA